MNATGLLLGQALGMVIVGLAYLVPALFRERVYREQERQSAAWAEKQRQPRYFEVVTTEGTHETWVVRDGQTYTADGSLVVARR